MERLIRKYTKNGGEYLLLTNVARTKQKRLTLSLVEEFRLCKVRLFQMVRNSYDPQVKNAQPSVITDRKWKANVATEIAESALKMKEIIGTVANGRAGLGPSSTALVVQGIHNKQKKNGFGRNSSSWESHSCRTKETEPVDHASPDPEHINNALRIKAPIKLNPRPPPGFSFGSVMCGRVGGVSVGSVLGPTVVGVFVGFPGVDLFSGCAVPGVCFRCVDDAFSVFGGETGACEFFPLLVKCTLLFDLLGVGEWFHAAFSWCSSV